jgi:hypothetical protein
VRRPLVLLAALLLVVAIAAPASAATVQRTWRGSVGTSAANGTHQLSGYVEGNGRLDVQLKAMKWNTTYRVEIRSGRCSSLGSVLYRPSGVRTGAGTVTTARGIPQSAMNTIWSVARCGNLDFSKSTRIRVPAYSIDLPVIKSPSGYPYCNVAMWLKELNQPTEPGVTYIFGHARKGMFLPLLTASKTSNGAAMIGKTVYVYTSNNKRHQYTITQVRRHVSSIQNVFGVTAETLWIQTSEGPNSSYPKLIVVAKRVATVAAPYSSAHPTPRPVRC